MYGVENGQKKDDREGEKQDKGSIIYIETYNKLKCSNLKLITMKNR